MRHALSAELAREKRGAARLGGEREALLASSSWRLTAPLRAGRRKLSQAKRLLRFEKPDPLFDAKWYLDRYEDVRNSGMEPYDHFVRHGAAEGRSPGPLFDARWYLDRNPDVRDEGLSPFKHYVEHGDREGRDPNPYFDTSWYREHYPDVATANTNALRHFIRHGAAEGRNPNPLFDTSWYMEQNPDAAELGLNPLVHYKLIGKGRKADPSLRFDTELYLRLYKDVADAGVDPLDHFLRYGQAGGRVACVPFSPVEAAEICVLKPPAVGREAALFVTHSPAGRLKPHVRHYLHALRRQGVDVVLLVAADAEFVEADAALLGEVAGLVVRRNSGLDFAAWAHALRLHPELYGVEILYLLNDSLFGPTNDADFAALLSRIRDSAADFVGLTESQEISWHVQSFFVALKARALASRAFHKFIDGVVAFADKDKVIRQYEVRLAPTLRRAGLVCEVAFPSTTQSDNRTLFDWRGLIDEGFPFVKVMALRDGFADDGGRSWREVLAGKGYDVSLAERTLAEARGGPKDPPPAKPLAELKALHIAKIEDGLSAFLASGARLRFTRSEQPAMSIVLVLFNKAHFTYACLASLERRLGRAPFPYEIIVYDNGSSDRTGELLERCDNLVVRRDESNLGFLRAVNAASELARGETLLLLNNDTELPEGTLEAALDLIRENDDVGAVGARLILPDGLLQEAGSIMWNDGTCLGYRRGADPEHFEANFRRDVDYCSGAFLLTRTALFHDLGRFNEIFVPAYYEETDYCLRLWENGWRIVYDPAVVVNHFEFASAANNDQAIQLQIRNRDKFLALHADTLARHLPPAPANVLFARTAGPRKLRLLVIDDFVPHDALGAGFPRARRMIEGLRAAGAEVTLLPTFDRPHPWTEIRKTLDPRVEVAFGYSMETAFEFIKARAGFYDAVLVSRPHNMTPLNAALEREPDLLRGRPVVYDAEALFTDRDIALKRLRGETVPQEEQARLLEEEMQIARFASTVLCVSPGERDKVARRWPDKEVRVLGHALEPRPTRNGFAERGGILFVGAIHADHTPNGDSIIWFVDKVLPLLRQKLREPFKFIVAGLNKSPAVSQRVGRDVVATGALDDLSQLFGDSRIFVAPTRFAAGIPHKIHEAASRGLPCVTTPLLAGQLGWRDGRDLLTGDDAEAFAEACARLYTDASLWARLRENALERVRQDCSPERFKETIDAVEAGLAADMKAREAQG
ncbi:glycosyltransferase [Methylocella sp.]|uniref:glycosyltransferase n=1 Tax=Methylocella sp. TaxID=1978226 RepID=UPI003783EA7F